MEVVPSGNWSKNDCLGFGPTRLWTDLKKKNAVVFTKYDFKLFLLIPLLPESKVNASVDPRPSTACDVMSLTIKDNLVIYLLQGKRRRSVLKRGGGGAHFQWAIRIPLLKFSKLPFALFVGTSNHYTVSSVSFLDLWQCISTTVV